MQSGGIAPHQLGRPLLPDTVTVRLRQRPEQGEAVQPARLLLAEGVELATQGGGPTGFEVLPDAQQQLGLEGYDRSEVDAPLGHPHPGHVAALEQAVAHQRFRTEQVGVAGKGRDKGGEWRPLQEFPDEESARQWIDHPDAAAEWMSGAGMGAYPPLFVGRFFDMMRIET